MDGYGFFVTLPLMCSKVRNMFFMSRTGYNILWYFVSNVFKGMHICFYVQNRLQHSCCVQYACFHPFLFLLSVVLHSSSFPDCPLFFEAWQVVPWWFGSLFWLKCIGCVAIWAGGLQQRANKAAVVWCCRWLAGLSVLFFLPGVAVLDARS